jgi:alpha-tubulin suppressor-like RCC1 family protein
MRTHIGDDTDEVYVTGENDRSQLGIPSTSEEHHVSKWTPLFQTLQIPSLHIRRVACGGKFTMFITNDGIAYSAGSDSYGQLCMKGEAMQNGLNRIVFPDSPTTVGSEVRIKDCTCGDIHVFLLTTDGYLIGCGYV